MIIDAEKYDDGALPSEAPPAYEQLGTIPSFTDSKSEPSPSSPSSSSSHPTPVHPPFTSSIERRLSKGSVAWFNRGGDRTAREVRATVLGLVRQVVGPQPMAGTAGILTSCAQTCERFGLSFGALLQEKSIEGHTPHYWAIVNRRLSGTSDGAGDGEVDTLEELLKLSTPLTRETESDMRFACLTVSDQALFARLQARRMSGTDEMLFGRGAPLDAVCVRGGDGAAFAVDLAFGMFQKRMRVGSFVGVEFIARGRMWALSFSVASAQSTYEEGSWLVTLALLEHSPPTSIDARLIIDEADGSSKGPPIEIRLRPGYGNQQQLVAYRADATTLDKWAGRDKIVVSLEDNSTATHLQYAESSYIDADGTLKARLEASLTPGEPDCVIC